MNILLCGHQGSGKTTIANYFLNLKEFKIYNAGEILDNYIREKGLTPTYENKFKYSNILRNISKLGSIFEFGKNLNSNFILYDSIVSWEDYKYCQEEHKKIFLIGIVAEEEIRYQRILKRKRKDDLYITKEKLKKIEEINNINEIISLSDFIITNNTNSPLQLQEELKTILTRIKYNHV